MDSIEPRKSGLIAMIAGHIEKNVGYFLYDFVLFGAVSFRAHDCLFRCSTPIPRVLTVNPVLPRGLYSIEINLEWNLLDKKFMHDTCIHQPGLICPKRYRLKGSDEVLGSADSGVLAPIGGVSCTEKCELRIWLSVKTRGLFGRSLMR